MTTQGNATDARLGRRYGQCDNTCTADCGHCKGAGPPAPAAPPVEDGGGER